MPDKSMPDLKRCYEILEIGADASPEEVKLAYRDLVSIWHPDKYCHNPRLMEKAERKMQDINRAWQDIQTYFQAREQTEQLERQSTFEKLAQLARQRQQSRQPLVVLNPADVELGVHISTGHAHRAYKAAHNSRQFDDADPGLADDVTDFGAGWRETYRSPRPERQGPDSGGTDLQQPAIKRSETQDTPLPAEAAPEMSRKMKLLTECYVQGRWEVESRTRAERRESKKALEETLEKTLQEQKKKHKQFTDRYLEGYRFWLADEREKFQAAERELQSRTGIYRLLRGVGRQKVFPYGIPNIRMVFIFGGSFAMGKDDKDSLLHKITGFSSHHPRHKVILRDFYLSKYPVTERQWSLAMGVERQEQYQNMPILLCWRDVQKFIARLNDITGLSFRLPTEAEWEYAARSGGRDEKWPRESNGSLIFEYAAVGRNEVGLHKPNELGLFDMLGNVGEWTNDWYDPKYYTHSDEVDPTGPERETRKTVRGSVLFDALGNPLFADSFSRSFLPVTWLNRAGFRLAHSLL